MVGRNREPDSAHSTSIIPNQVTILPPRTDVMGKKDDATELIVLLACNGSAVGEEACRETTVSRANIVVVVERVKGLWLVLLPRF